MWGTQWSLGLTHTTLASSAEIKHFPRPERLWPSLDHMPIQNPVMCQALASYPMEWVCDDVISTPKHGLGSPQVKGVSGLFYHLLVI